MKNILSCLFLVGLFSLCSCSESPQEKAEVFAEELMQKCLNDPSTYEPVETQIDSVFYNIYFEEDVREKLEELNDLHSELNLNDTKFEENQREINRTTEAYTFEKHLYSGYGYDSYSKYNINEAKEEMNAAKNKQLEITEERKTIEKSITECETYLKERYEQAPKSYFIGWQIIHSFRIIMPNGRKSLCNVWLFVDKNMENLLIDQIIEESDTDFVDNLELLHSILGVERLAK